MRLTAMLVLALFAALVANWMTEVARASPEPPPTASTDSVRRMTLDEVRQGLDKGTIYLVDVRSARAYRSGHIPGAVGVPLRQVGDQFYKFPRNKLIVLYCT